MNYEDLPDEAQEAFDEVAGKWQDKIDRAVAEDAYANAIEDAVDGGNYASGLATRFNLDESQIATADAWESAVEDAVENGYWETQMEKAGVDEKFRDKLAQKLTT